MDEPVFQTYEVENSPAFGLEIPQTYPWTWPEQMPRSANTTAVAASLVAMVGQGRFIGATIANSGSAQFFQLFDASSLPADGAIPIASIDIAANTAKALYYGPDGRWMRQGIVLCNSSTIASKTIGSANCLFDVQYVPQVI